MSIKRYPGFIDIHSHLREPGATHKEDFASGTRAAIAGGFTYVIDMPNNPNTPTFTPQRLEEKITLSHQKALCDVGFHFGTNGLNTESFKSVWDNPLVYGLKIFCNHSTGHFLVENLALLEKIFIAWNSEKPILVHAEGMHLAGAITLAHFYNRKLHVCHIAQKAEVELVRIAKRKGYAITAGVCPHYLYLTDIDVERIGWWARVKPPIATKDDQDGLWAGLQDKTIDIVETDHAPHTKEEKESSDPPVGMPNLETTVGLLFKAVHDKKLKEEDISRLLYERPKELFHIPTQDNTYVELDPQMPYRIGKDGYYSKSGWSVFDGWEAYGKPDRVVLRGKICLEDGRIVV